MEASGGYLTDTRFVLKFNVSVNTIFGDNLTDTRFVLKYGINPDKEITEYNLTDTRFVLK